ncbi:PDZ domain-containing protein [Mangrovimonas sp. CR14]|uniref:PDZ domain-containing protein n=1 Tax=Mangrovimonas sp. CR14 TaxID=2706120 RepID=UPI001F0DD30C|nr:PDZ domain-containing protein [Mangrovimonas sp. CR14]
MMRYVLTLILACSFQFSLAQGRYVIQNKKGSDKIHFKLVNNLIVIPIKVNGVELSFLLDTGVSKPIIFNFLNLTDSLQIEKTSTIFLRGLGEGQAVESIKSEGNVVQLGDAINVNQDLYIIYDSALNFTPRLGFPLHGIIGFDLFKDLIVEINYSSRFIRITDPKIFRYRHCKSCVSLEMELHKNKPYVDVAVVLMEEEIPVKLLVDTGGSDALWLFENKRIVNNQSYFNDFLGHGLSGSVHGKRSKLKKFILKEFELKNTNVSFPDTSDIAYIKKIKGRDGSLAGNILKRFNLVVDYPNSKISFKKNRHFKDPFNYNNSGIELEHDGVRLITEEKAYYEMQQVNREDNNMPSTKIVLNPSYKLALKPAFSIVEIRPGSAAERAGLELGDVVLSVNGRPCEKYTLQEVMLKFYEEVGKEIELEVDRNGDVLEFKFELESPFKK